MAGAEDVATATIYRADGLLFRAQADNPSDQAMLDALLCDLRTDDASASELPTYTLSRIGTSRRMWVIEGPRVDRYVTQDVSDAIARLLAGLSVAMLDASPHRLHLHSAAASRDGSAVLIAAPRHTGKTTTIANLLARGWCFLTDETVAIDAPPRVHGVPRPLAIKPGGREHIRLPVEFAVPESLDSASHQYVPIGPSGVPVCDAALAKLVVLLRRSSRAGTDPLVERLHPADAVVALMQETLDAARFGSEAVVRLAELSAATLSVRLTRGSPDLTVDVICDLAEEEPPPSSTVHCYERTESIDSQVVSLTVGGRAVVHHVGSGLILAFDEPATRVWEVAGGWANHAEIDLDAPVVSAFMGQLRDHGLLSSAGAPS